MPLEVGKDKGERSGVVASHSCQGLLLGHTFPLLRLPQARGKQQESSFLALVAATPVGSVSHSFPDFTGLGLQRPPCTILRRVGMGAGLR